MSCDVNSIHVYSRHTCTCLARVDRENDDIDYIYISFLIRLIYKLFIGHRSIVKLDESSTKFHDSLVFKATIDPSA